MSAWDELADAVLTHDVERERHAWQELTCLGCRRETAIPGEHECADCLIASARRRDDMERAAILARTSYRRWSGAA